MIIIDTNVLLAFLLTNGITRRVIIETAGIRIGCQTMNYLKSLLI
ncbi:MAG: hypothetical protein OIN90_13005 [Candidatus Methanoperedens sp.]|nr:hypothetical protein [Candidatus Methanoperedens sp. BLZ2]MCX9078116.1 hypothetical protein [Candidatus Methanoperedens sp.]MCX9088469.1 hypothetical protein [Candidatus Methanoperedens sp.]